MPIWSVEIKEIERLYESLKGQLPDLEKELERLIKADDENMILLYSRRCLEVIISELCECELKRPRKTEPLQGVIDKLHKEEKVPSHIIASMQSLNTLSTFGAHPKDFDPEQVKPVLINLDIIIKWYLRYKKPGSEINAKPAEETRKEIKRPEEIKRSPQSKNKRLIGLVSGFMLLIVIVAAVLFFTGIISGGRQKKELEKSIAVLPFENYTPGDSNQYFINGLMDEILINLQKIKSFAKVHSPLSTAQYKSYDRSSIPEIARRLGVNYLVGGSGEKYGTAFKLRVYLIEANNKKTIWADSYEEEIKETRDIFRIQSQIAQAIASELKAVITPEEKQLIEKVPTVNLNAYDFYRMGVEEEGKFPYHALTASSATWSPIFMVSTIDKRVFERAEKMYKTALKYDTTFAQAYSGLAGVYWSKNYYREYFSENFLDSAMVLAKKALSFDDQLPDAHYIMGAYYGEKGFYKLALQEFDKTLKYNPNYWLAYFGKGNLYFDESNYVMALENFLEAVSRYHGSGFSDMLRRICLALDDSGFSEQEKPYHLEAIKSETDSIKYYFWEYEFDGDSTKGLEFLEKGYEIDSTNISILEFLGSYYLDTGQLKESLKFYKKYLARSKVQGITIVNRMHRIGYVYWKNGLKDSADYYFNKQIRYCNDAIRLGRQYGISWAYYDLAGVYAFQGNKIKAYENLRNFNNKKQRMPWWFADYFRTDPLFESIRNEPDFQKIANDVEAKYQAEHERVKKWLEEKGML